MGLGVLVCSLCTIPFGVVYQLLCSIFQVSSTYEDWLTKLDQMAESLLLGLCLM